MGINPTGSQVEKLMEQVSAQSVWPELSCLQVGLK